MHRKYYLIIVIILIVVAIVGLVFFGGMRSYVPIGIMPVAYSYSVFPQITNVSQGETQVINLTLTSSGPLMIVPIENLTLSWPPGLVHETVFDYSFSFSQLTLQPNMSNSTILTIKWADHAPTETFYLDIFLGKIEFLSAHPADETSFRDTVILMMTVTPKTT